MNYLKKSKLFLLIIGFSLFANSIFAQQNTQDKIRKDYDGPKAKYIFFFIGDGMGLSQTTATEGYLSALNDKIGITKLNLSKFPVTGFFTTYAENRFITGSAAAGTAMSTGHKTTVNTIGMMGNKIDPLENIAEKAYKKNYKVGVVTSVSIDHATPAAFYAHQASRNMYYKISCDLSNSGFNYFAGGGIKRPEGELAKKANNNLSNFGMGKSKETLKKGQENSIIIAKKRGYSVYNTRAEFDKLKHGDDKVITIAPRLVGGKSLPYDIDTDKKDISLKEFTAKGIELLNNDQGFFMMVEGGKIDWACHANDAATVIREVIAFDNAVKEAVEFYNKHPKETLIIVAGDHETGGLGLGFSGKHYKSAYAILQHQNVSYEKFSSLINEYKENNKRRKFSDILVLLNKHFGLGGDNENLKLSDYELSQLKDAYTQSMKKRKKEKTDEQYIMYGSYEPITVTACHILAQKAGIAWTSYSHTATPIPVRAIGVGAELFKGFYDNTDLPKNIEVLLK